MKYLRTFLFAVMAGAFIGIGGAAYLACENKLVGSLLFTFGLFGILVFGFNLYTGKICYLFCNKPSYLIDLLLIWLGNFAGAFLVARLLLLTRQASLQETARAMCEIKMNDSPLSIFILAVFCGIMVYIAVECYKNIADVGKYIAIAVCVVLFIVACFEHCVATMFYFSFNNMWTWKAFLYILIMTAGNSLGGLIVPLVRRLLPSK